MGLGRATERGKNQPRAELKEGDWNSGVWRVGRGGEYEEEGKSPRTSGRGWESSCAQNWVVLTTWR